MAASTIVASLTACNLIPPADSREVATGVIWRGVITHQYKDSINMRAAKIDPLGKYNFKDERDIGIRMSGFQVGYGWYATVGNAFLPDNIELSQMKRGAVVDVLISGLDTLNYDTQNFNRIIRIVCDYDDDPCIDAEKKAKRYREKTGEASPLELPAKLGLTFNRRVTPAEDKEYRSIWTR